jgi:hypothetical protein
MFCDWHTLSVSLMLIFKTNEDECNDIIYTLYMHFKKHSSNRYGHAEYYWIRYEYVVVFSCTCILTGLDPVGTTCVLTVLWFTDFTFWNIFAKELYMLLQTSCQMALLYFSVIISNKTLCWNLWEGPLRCLMRSGGHSIQTFIILLELCLYMWGVWNECVDCGTPVTLLQSDVNLFEWVLFLQHHFWNS